MRYTFPVLLLTGLAIAVQGTAALAQLNPAGFQDPAGASRGGTGNPPNAPSAPLPPAAGTNLSPSMFDSQREIENNPALRQEVRRPFGAGTFRGGLGERSGTADADPAKGLNFSERQNTGHAEKSSDAEPVDGELASDWRYVFYQGRHWYRMPNKTWDVWKGNAWVPYRPHMFERPIFGYGTQVRGYRPLPPGAETANNTKPTTKPNLSQPSVTRVGSPRTAGAVKASRESSQPQQPDP